MSSRLNDNRIETNYPSGYGGRVVDDIYQNIKNHRLSLVIGFKGIGKSSVANFLAYNRKHVATHSHGQKIVFCKFSFNSLTNQSPRSFIFHLINNINDSLALWEVPVVHHEAKSSMPEYDMLNVLRNQIRDVGRAGHILVIIFDPVEALLQHEQRHKVFQYLRHLFDHNRNNLNYIFFSNHPNIVKFIDFSNFGVLSSSVNSGVVWFQPSSLSEYHYYLYHDYRLLDRLIFRRIDSRRQRYIYRMSGGITTLINYFRDIKSVNPDVVYKALADQTLLNSCRGIISSFNEQQRIFLYYLANEIDEPVYILRSDVDILERSGIIRLNKSEMRFEVNAEILVHYLRQPNAYNDLFLNGQKES